MTTLTTENIVNGILKFNGSDTVKFLQGQVSCDINKLTLNKALPGVYCTPQGRIRASFIIIKIAEDDYLMLLPKSQISFLLEVMAPYIAFFQSSMEDVSDTWNVFGLSATDNTEVTAELTDETWHMNIIDNVIFLKLPGETPRWHCLSSKSLNEKWSKLQSTTELGWLTDDLKSGMVWITDKNRELFLPHDLSMPTLGAINFEKGCYTGQEIVARMEYRGKPKYCIGVISTQPIDSDIPEKLVQLLDNSDEIKIGQVVEKLQLTDNSWLILASIKRNVVEQEKLLLSLSETAILCTIEYPYSVSSTRNTDKESNDL
ncbi:MAG: folate-binding protein YgfZ [Enterobacterales bacterium]|jgi:folate-binding protein YgfZ